MTEGGMCSALFRIHKICNDWRRVCNARPSEKAAMLPSRFQHSSQNNAWEPCKNGPADQIVPHPIWVPSVEHFLCSTSISLFVPPKLGSDRLPPHLCPKSLRLIFASRSTFPTRTQHGSTFHTPVSIKVEHSVVPWGWNFSRFPTRSAKKHKVSTRPTFFFPLPSPFWPSDAKLDKKQFHNMVFLHHPRSAEWIFSFLVPMFSRHQYKQRPRVHGEQEHQFVSLHSGKGHPSAVSWQTRTHPVQRVEAHQTLAGTVNKHLFTECELDMGDFAQSVRPRLVVCRKDQRKLIRTLGFQRSLFLQALKAATNTIVWGRSINFGRSTKKFSSFSFSTTLLGVQKQSRSE